MKACNLNALIYCRSIMQKRHLLLATALALLPASAWANIGVPMLALTLPASVLALIPVVLIEAYIFKRGGFQFKWSLKWIAISNLVTTFIGVPLTWGIFVGITILGGGGGCHPMNTTSEKIFAVLKEAAWLCPYENELHWMVPTAYLILLVPFFLISWKIESWIIWKRNKSLDQALINKLCLSGNVLTYMLLALYPVSMYFMQ